MFAFVLFLCVICSFLFKITASSDCKTEVSSNFWAAWLQSCSKVSKTKQWVSAVKIRMYFLLGFQRDYLYNESMKKISSAFSLCDSAHCVLASIRPLALITAGLPSQRKPQGDMFPHCHLISWPNRACKCLSQTGMYSIKCASLMQDCTCTCVL